MPSPINGAWSPIPDGTASLASWVKAPSVGVVAAAWIPTVPSAVRTSCAFGLVSASEVATTYGGRRSSAPGCEITITASIESRSGRLSIRARMPSAPELEPLVDAST